MYWFSDASGNVLYVGKAKNLKKRMQSYDRGQRHSHRIGQLVREATQLQHRVLESELTALLVEAELIRTYQPSYNILLKDDKSPLYIHITQETYPRVQRVRKKEVIAKNLKGTFLGPFPSAYAVQEVLKISRDIFPWCNQAGNGEGKGVKTQGTTKKPCFYYHLDLCPGACTGEITPEAYRENIRELVLFLRGKTKKVTTQVKNRLQESVLKENFEDAARYRDILAHIQTVTSQNYRLKPNFSVPRLSLTEAEDGVIYLQQVVSTYLYLPKQRPLSRIECYDVSNISGTNAAVAMVTFSDGHADPSQYRLFNIRTLDTPNDYQMMKEALIRRQNNLDWGEPDLIVIDGGKGQLRAALSIWQHSAPVISIAKDPDRLLIPHLNWAEASRELPISLKKLEYHEIKLPETHPGLVLLQKLRNEAHRFSKKQHTRRRTKAMFE